jgi:hypothetical protein
MLNYFLNLFLASPANPTNPEPRRIMVAGSGTGTGVQVSWLNMNSLHGVGAKIVPYMQQIACQE